MAKISVKRFVELLQKSGLVPDTVLRDSLTQMKKENNGAPLADTDQVKKKLIEQGMITTWQSDKLLSQKYKGFFLGKYKILGHIGTGGMSSVYLVEHMQMHQRRAIKVLPRKRVSDKTYLERFYIEARASASLDHPNIVRAFDVDHDEDSETHYLVMEYVDGRDLGKIIEEDGPIAPRDAASYIAQAADALQFAHDEGVVHRDVKPGNILVDRNNDVKILDMGLALFKEDDFSLTLEYNEKILGTADYLAPEQALNSHTVDHRADIYGLGCTLFFILTGEPPFNEGTLAQRIVMHQKAEPKRISTYRKDCPEELQEILSLMMEKDVDKRIQTCQDVKNILTAWLAGKPIHAKTKVSVSDGNLPEGAEKKSKEDEVADVLDAEMQRAVDVVGESLKTSSDDTMSQRKARSPAASSGSHSKIRLTAVSFSDIVAGSELDPSPSHLDMEPGTQSRAAGELVKNVTEPEETARRGIDVTPTFLVIIVLVSVFASSAFTILILDWLGLLGG